MPTAPRRVIAASPAVQASAVPVADQELAVLTEIGQLLSSSLDLREVFGKMMQIISDKLNMRRGTLILLASSYAALGTTPLMTFPVSLPTAIIKAVAVDAAGTVYVSDTGNNRIQVLSNLGQPVAQWGRQGTGPAQFNAPRGLAVDAQGNVYVADTNNHAIRVVDLKTKETRTLPIKGLQPPAFNQTAVNNEVAPNAEEVKLPSQRLRAGDAAVVINVDLPTGYHLNPAAPQRYVVSIQQGTEELKTSPTNVNKTGKGLTLPIRVPIGLGAGAATARVSFTFVYCREDNTGTCRIKTLQWQAPLEVVNDANITNEINLHGKVD